MLILDESRKPNLTEMMGMNSPKTQLVLNADAYIPLTKAHICVISKMFKYFWQKGMQKFCFGLFVTFDKTLGFQNAFTIKPYHSTYCSIAKGLKE